MLPANDGAPTHPCFTPTTTRYSYRAGTGSTRRATGYPLDISYQEYHQNSFKSGDFHDCLTCKRFLCNSLFNTKILVLELQDYHITDMDYIGDMSFLDLELIQPNGMSLLAIN